MHFNTRNPLPADAPGTTRSRDVALGLPAVALIDLPTGRAYERHLLAGDRQAARRVVDDAIAGGMNARALLLELCWPIMERLQQMYRDDVINRGVFNLATRLNRSTVDRVGTHLPSAKKVGKSVLIVCGDDEPEELGGQICADLFEASGWDVRFGGGGIPNDEVLGLLGRYRPNLLVMFATRPQGVPAVRQLIDYLREVDSCPSMQIMCCGGIYKRAEGLAEEIGADLYAPDAGEAVRIATLYPRRKATPEQQTVGRARRARQAKARQALKLVSAEVPTAGTPPEPSAADVTTEASAPDVAPFSIRTPLDHRPSTDKPGRRAA